MVLAWTIHGLVEAGHDVRVIAPVAACDQAPDEASGWARCRVIPVPVRRRSWLRSLWGAFWRRRAVTSERHGHDAVARAVADCVATWQPEVVHAEQLQAFQHCDAAIAAGIPIVLRMQNVESDLWRQMSKAHPLAAWLAFEARRVRRDECAAMRRADRVLTLSERDRDALADIADPRDVGKLAALAPAFPNALPAGPARQGAPAVALVGSAGWWPNAQALQWFLAGVYPALRQHVPGARVHVFGGRRGDEAEVVWHSAPDDAEAAFPENAIVAIPLLVGSGIRMRMLEAWARGLPVVASTVAAAGLRVQSGRELLIADTADAFAAAIARLQADPSLRSRLIEGGRDYLATHHDIGAQSERLVASYLQARRSDR